MVRRSNPIPHRSRAAGAGGFTLIELMVVISIILILISFAAPIYQRSVVHAKEAVLKQDLYTLREAIDNYTMDKAKAPQSLQDLVDAGYLKQLPKDPFTNSTDSWQVVQEDVLASIDQNEPGINDVHSGSTGTAEDGTAYNTW
jgi:general secretion pathway protein G